MHCSANICDVSDLATAPCTAKLASWLIVQVQQKDKPLVAAQAKTLARLIQDNAANKDMLHRLGELSPVCRISEHRCIM